MPRGHTTDSLSNLSALIPRRIHLKAKLLAYDANLPLPVIVAWALDQVPESVSQTQKVEMLMKQVELTVLSNQQNRSKSNGFR